MSLAFPKLTRWKNKKYLEWIRKQPCVITGFYGCEPHHAIGLKLSGMGLTAPDWAVMPVTRGSHNFIHATPSVKNQQWKWITQTLQAAYIAGVIDIDPDTTFTDNDRYPNHWEAQARAIGEAIENA